VTTTADITAKALAASFSGTSKVYDGGVAASVTGSSTDKLTGDVLTYDVTSASFDNKNVGDNKQISVSGISLGGSDAGNYVLQTINASATGAITPKLLQVIGTKAADKSEDGNTNAQVVPGVLSGLVGQEQVQAVIVSGQFDSPLPGNNKPVVVQYRLMDGVNSGQASNYNLPNEMVYARIMPLRQNNNTVQPIILPDQTGKAPSQRVVIVKAQAAVGSAILESKNVRSSECSFLNLESCDCEETEVKGIEVCMTFIPSAAQIKLPE
jgi:hypothetical protein